MLHLPVSGDVEYLLGEVTGVLSRAGASSSDDDEDEVEAENDENKHGSAQVGILGGENPEGEANSPPCKGGPFSALTPSMWPAKGKINQAEKYDTCDHKSW